MNSLSRFGVIKSTFSAHHLSSVFNARHHSSAFSEIIFVIAHRQSSSTTARLLQGTNSVSWIVIVVFTNSQCSSFLDRHLIILCNATFLAATCCKQAYVGVSQSHSLLLVASVFDDPKIIPSFHRKMIMNYGD